MSQKNFDVVNLESFTAQFMGSFANKQVSQRLWNASEKMTDVFYLSEKI